MLRAVLFDLFDTLVYVDEAGLRAKVHACADAAAVTPDDFRRVWFETSRSSIRGQFPSIEDRAGAVLRALGRAAQSDVVARIASEERSFLRTHVHPFPDAHRILEVLRADGVKSAIVTNASASVALVLDRCGLRERVDDVVVSSEVRAVKPDPGIYALVLSRIAVVAADAAYVGDGNDAELDGAKALGMHTILVRREHPRYGVRAASSDAAVDVIVTALSEIPAHVRCLRP